MNDVQLGNNTLNVFPIYDDTACAWCNLKPPPGQNLKRCRGCNVVLYCGKVCQEAAWPTHRSICRSHSHQAGEVRRDLAGYTTTIGLTSAIGEWAEIHKYSLTVIAHAVTRANGGIEANLRLGRMIVFVLSSQRADSSLPDDNPARAFKLTKINHQDGEYVPPLRKVSEGLGQGVQGGFCGDPNNRTPVVAGFAPVLCIVEGTQNPRVSRYPIYLPSHHPYDIADGQFYFDVHRIFFGLINYGVVMQPPSDGRAGPPRSETMVRMRKTWRWQHNQRLWQHLDAVMPYQNPPLGTSGSATDLWMRFQQW